MQAPQVYYALELKLAFENYQNPRSLCHTQSVRQAATSGPHTAACLATPDGLQSAVKAATWPTDLFLFLLSSLSCNSGSVDVKVGCC